VRRIHEIRRIRRLLTLKEVHLFMELCDGKTVQDDRPTDLREAVRVFAAVAEGLAHMNARGFVHADTKPNNILVAPDGAVKIIDFGQSCPLGTVKERVQGTPDFIAPEQVHRRPLDARTDVFNFGAALYWTLTGRAIPTALPRKGALTMKSEMMVQPIEQSNPDVPPAVTKLVMDCIEVQPSRRPETMNEVASRLHLIAHKLHLDANGGIPPQE
jgi:serine/threonine-protein kinase